MELCGKRFSYAGCEYTCHGPRGHLGLHRSQPKLRDSTMVWGDNECSRDVPEEQPARVDATVDDFNFGSDSHG